MNLEILLCWIITRFVGARIFAAIVHASAIARAAGVQDAFGLARVVRISEIVGRAAIHSGGPLVSRHLALTPQRESDGLQPDFGGLDNRRRFGC